MVDDRCASWGGKDSMERGKSVLKVVLVLMICSSWPGKPMAAQEKVVIVGSGSYLPLRLYQAWTNEFNKGHDGIQVQYMPLGSSESLLQISQGVGDFGGGEVPLAQAQLRGSKIPLVQIPTALVGIVPVYRLPGNPELNFSGELLGQIYLGTVRNWNDSRIAKLNPNVQLPDLAIRVVHRSGGKGSNYIFTDFLSKTSPQFRALVGTSPSPKWPVGAEADSSPELIKKVESTPGAIGYVELGFIAGASVGRGRVQNQAGRFISATFAGIQAACSAMHNDPPAELQMDLTNAPGRDSYPIASFTWVYLSTRASTARRNALKQFLGWSLRDGQRIAKNLGYVPLPRQIAAEALAAVNSAL